MRTNTQHNTAQHSTQLPLQHNSNQSTTNNTHHPVHFVLLDPAAVVGDGDDGASELPEFYRGE